MSDQVLEALDGHRLSAHVAHPAGAPKGGVVILQEIFGLDAHTRHVADRYAEAGYLAVAPAMFDRIEPGAAIGYDEIQRGLAIMQAIRQDALVADLQAAVDAASAGGKVVAIGFCWGGALAYLTACRCGGIVGGVSYYGTRIQTLCETLKPLVPMLYHFGGRDKSIPPEGIAKIHAADPESQSFVYEGADHAFTNEARPSYKAAEAALAHERTARFLKRVIAG
jgi:carboxymethylenebutenolidase